MQLKSKQDDKMYRVMDRLKRMGMMLASGGVASAFFNVFQGRCTFAAICFSVVGIYGWLQGRDLTSFALFVTAVQGLLVLHSWKEDVAEQYQIQHGRSINQNPQPPAAS